MRTLEAKVSGSELTASSSFFSTLAAGVGTGAANGFAPALWDENGFAGPEPLGLVAKGLEKGLAAGVELELLLTPNSDSPILDCGLGSSLTSFFCSTLTLDLADAPLAIRTPLIPRTLPSLRLHVFLRQLQMYSRRSCPGNWSGRSPFSSRRRVSKPLQTLHFASAPDGAVLSSSQLCESCQCKRKK